MILKTHQLGQPQKWHLIEDLSAPQGQSVNEGIKPELCSLSYPSVEEAASMACYLGHHPLMAKLDLKNAYQMVPVHAEDRHLLVVKWKGVTFVDGALPFGQPPKLKSEEGDPLFG